MAISCSRRTVAAPTARRRDERPPSVSVIPAKPVSRTFFVMPAQAASSSRRSSQFAGGRGYWIARSSRAMTRVAPLSLSANHTEVVMAGVVPAIHVLSVDRGPETWMPGTRPGMTATEMRSLIPTPQTSIMMPTPRPVRGASWGVVSVGRGAAPAGLVATRHSDGSGAPPGTTRSSRQELARRSGQAVGLKRARCRQDAAK